MASLRKDGVNIGTVSGGIVNFGGTAIIAPISITNTTGGSGGSNSASSSTSSISGLISSTNQQTVSDILNLIRTVL